MPEVAEAVLAEGAADMVSMARPFLADSHWVKKAKEGKVAEINTCIGCNQACLDHIFSRKTASCLVNPRACRETEMPFVPTDNVKKVAVVGAGPAGLACAVTAAARGHLVTLFEANDHIGGQFRLARQIPGKEEFEETLRYYRHQLELHEVELRLHTEPTPDELRAFDKVILSTGVVPRNLEIKGRERSNVHLYSEVLRGEKIIGSSVAIIGAGGIGFDTATFLLDDGAGSANDIQDFMAEWGVDMHYESEGGLGDRHLKKAPRKIYLLQRKTTKPGLGLGKTTGWIHRSHLKKFGVNMLNGVEYLAIEDKGLRIRHQGQEQLLEVSDVVICAGQLSELGLAKELDRAGIDYQIIGGALKAGELDAKRAILQGTELADSI